MYKRKNINEIVNETIYQFPSIKFVSKLEERIEEVGLNLTELSNLTGIRYASLNELKNGKKVTLNLQHIMAIMVALRLKSLDDLFELHFDDSDKLLFEEESEQYRKEGIPESALERMKENKKRLDEMYNKKSTD